MYLTWRVHVMFFKFYIIYKSDSRKSLWRILQGSFQEFKQDRARYSNTSKNDFLLHRIFFHTYIYIYKNIVLFAQREKEKREKRDISSCLIVVNKRRVIYRPSEFLADIAYFKPVRFTHLLFVLFREDKRNNPDGLDKRKNLEKLDGLRQSCHRQWHSRGGLFPWKDDWYLAKVAKRMVNGPLTAGDARTIFTEISRQCLLFYIRTNFPTQSWTF